MNRKSDTFLLCKIGNFLVRADLISITLHYNSWLQCQHIFWSLHCRTKSLLKQFPAFPTFQHLKLCCINLHLSDFFCCTSLSSYAPFARCTSIKYNCVMPVLKIVANARWNISKYIYALFKEKIPSNPFKSKSSLHILLFNFIL